MFRSGDPPSLTRRTLWRVGSRIGLVVIAATIFGYWHVLTGLKEQALEQLERDVEQRRVRESTVFVMAQEHLDIVAHAYRRTLANMRVSESEARFAELFERRADGTLRLRARVFAQRGITGFVGKHVAVDVDLRRRLVAAVDVLEQFGPAWQRQYPNLHVVTPEHAVLMYWPEQPWALHASDWEINGKLQLIAGRDSEVVVLEPNSRVRVDSAGWSDLYFDYGVNDWMVSATRTVTSQGEHLLTVGQDILLNDLFERTLNSGIAGTYNLIFRQNGRLIAHPEFLEAIQAQSGALSIPEIPDDNLKRIFALSVGKPDRRTVVENAADSEYIGVARLEGPGWYLATVFPEHLVTSQAFETARLILLAGLLALCVEIGILWAVFRTQVSRPLGQLMQATDKLAAGRSYELPPACRRDDEIGRLGRAFQDMAAKVKGRQEALNERNAELRALNVRLAHELEERKRAEAEVAQQREALHQSEKLNALGSLLAGVAHELNNPLSVVVGRTLILEEKLAGTPHAAALAKVRKAAERCAGIVKTFLAMARQQTPSRQPVDVAELIHGALELVAYGLRTSGIEVRSSFDSRVPKLQGDPSQLIQVFTNLLVNAQQALAEHDGPRRLEIATELEPGGCVRVTVSDSGPGIPPEIRNRIFEPFFTTKPTGVGTGIGLSMCKGIVEGHGGRIAVHDAPGGGAVFIVRLPLAADRSCAPEEPAMEAPQVPQAAAVGARVLVVDDEPDVAIMMQDMLAGDGHEVAIAHGGQAALDHLAAAPVDVVVTDLHMPDMDGFTLFRRLSQVRPELTDRVVFVSGDTLSPAARRFLAEAGAPVVEKPFKVAELRQAIREAAAGLPAPRRSGGGHLRVV